MQLTQTVQKGGCAAKIAATELRKILQQVRFPDVDKNVLVDGGTFDDAAIYKVSDDIALVQTLDFFTPIVDTPNIFGKIAAANALSDVYAMGGIPKTGMAILAFPLAQFEQSVIVEVLQGAADVMSEAKVNFVGGHSIDDDTLKFGLSVTGYVHPQKIWTNSNAKVGDVLILTKALGTGTVTAGLKRKELTEAQMPEVLSSMTQLNSILELIPESLATAIHAATDITGFGLAGHGLQMATASKVSLNFSLNNLPVFALAWECLKKGFLTKAHRTNSEYTSSQMQMMFNDPIKAQILFDPQTSGGLLLSVQEDSSEELLKKLQTQFKAAQIVGRVEAQGQYKILVQD